MITVNEWAEIRHLHGSEGLSIRAIASRLNVARDTVARALESQGPPAYSRPPVVSALDAFDAPVRQLLAEFPSMPATVIGERVGWEGSPSWLRKRVALLRPEYAPKDPADRLSYAPGDQAQCDLWFPATPVATPIGPMVFPVLVMVASQSRFITGRMIPSRTTADLLAGMWSLLSEQLGAVPRRLIWDNEAGIGRRNKLAAGVAGFCGTLATRLVQLKPFDPESKGIVERANGFLETSFLPGRTFTSADDFNRQLAQWLPRANARTVRALGAAPVSLIGLDRAHMLPLPPVVPQVGFVEQVRLPRDYYVRVLGNDYSVEPFAIGRMVTVQADLSQVTVTLGDRTVASHARAWGRAQTITDPAHVTQARVLRELFQKPRAVPTDSELLRDLADYDTAFGVHIEGISA